MKKTRVWDLTKKMCAYLAQKNNADDLANIECTEKACDMPLLEDFFNDMMYFMNETIPTNEKETLYKTLGLTNSEIKMFEYEDDDDWEDEEDDDADLNDEDKSQITIIATDELPTDEENTWSYPFEELDYIFEQIADGTRENNETFYLYDGRLYESYETDEM